MLRERERVVRGEIEHPGRGVVVVVVVEGGKGGQVRGVEEAVRGGEVAHELRRRA